VARDGEAVHRRAGDEGTDMVDVFVEEMHPDDANLVRWKDDWEPLRVVEEDIAVSLVQYNGVGESCFPIPERISKISDTEFQG